MKKLIDAYRAKPTFKNAQRVRAYERAYGYCICLLSPADADLVARAIHHANTPQ